MRVSNLSVGLAGFDFFRFELPATIDIGRESDYFFIRITNGGLFPDDPIDLGASSISASTSIVSRCGRTVSWTSSLVVDPFDLGIHFAGIDVVAFNGSASLEIEGDIFQISSFKSASLSGSLIVLGATIASTAPELHRGGCLTIDALAQEFYIDLNRLHEVQNPYDPANIDCDGRTAPPRVITVGVESTNFAETIQTIGNTTLLNLATTEGNTVGAVARSIALTAYGLRSGESVTVNWQVVNNVSGRRIEFANSADYHGDVLAGSTILTFATPTKTVRQVIGDGTFEFNEQYALNFSATSAAAQRTSRSARGRYRIVNDDSERAGLVLHHDFDIVSGPGYTFSKVVDFQATPMSGARFTHTDELAPRVGVQFDGENDYVQAIMDANLPNGGTNDLTFEFWMRPGNITAFEHPIGLGGESRDLLPERQANNSINMKFGTLGIDSSLGTFTRGTWVHVAVTYDGTTRRGYLNGTLVRTTNVTGTISYPTLNVFIGTFDAATDKVFTGDIDEVRIWNVARSQAANFGQPPDGAAGHGAKPGRLLAVRRRAARSGRRSYAGGQDAILARPLRGRSPVWTEGADPPGTPDRLTGYATVTLNRDTGLPKIAPSSPVTEVPTSIHAAATDRCAREVLSENLVLNSGNESTGPGSRPVNWTELTTGWTTNDTQFNVAAAEGDQYFHYSIANATGTLIQDVSGAPLQDAIEKGEQRFFFSAYVMSHDRDRDGIARARPAILERGGTRRFPAAPTYDSGDLTQLLTWTRFTAILGTTPSATRFVRIILTSDPLGANARGSYFDNIALFSISDESKFYEFEVGPSAALLTSTQRFSFTGMTFFDYADPVGVGFWELRTSRDNFADPLAVDTTSVGEYDRTEIDMANFDFVALQCLSASDFPIRFRLHGVAGANGRARGQRRPAGHARRHHRHPMPGRARRRRNRRGQQSNPLHAPGERYVFHGTTVP